MAFAATEKNIYSLFNDSIYIIPRNQRKYVWTQNNWEEIYEDIKLVYTGKTNSHFLGSIVLKSENKVNNVSQFSIIDGQQRVLTLTIMISAIMFLFAEKQMFDNFEGGRKHLETIDSLGNKLNIISECCNKSVFYIVREILETKDTLNMKGFKNFIKELSGYPDIDLSILNCLKFFYERISSDNDKEDYLSDILNVLLSIGFVSINATNDEDSYTIFEILNARGIELEDHELVKNFIMRYIQPANNRDEAKLKWGSIENNIEDNLPMFFAHYVTHRYGIKSNKSDNRPYKIINKNEKGKDTSALLDDIILKSNFYKKIIHPEDGQCSLTESKVFKFFKTRKQRQFRPLILSLMHQRYLNNLTEDEYNNSLLYLYNFFVCYNIIGRENSNKLEDVVYKYSGLLENEFSQQILMNFKKSIKERIPGYNWFLIAFKKIGYSSSKHTLFTGSQMSTSVRIVLDIIENYFGNNNDYEYTIEHIIPDSTEDEIVVQLGNLLPLEKDLNEEIKDIILPNKLKIYSKSKYSLVKQFVENYDINWDIEKRTEQLADIVFNKILIFD